MDNIYHILMKTILFLFLIKNTNMYHSKSITLLLPYDANTARLNIILSSVPAPLMELLCQPRCTLCVCRLSAPCYKTSLGCCRVFVWPHESAWRYFLKWLFVYMAERNLVEHLFEDCYTIKAYSVVVVFVCCALPCWSGWLIRQTHTKKNPVQYFRWKR